MPDEHDVTSRSASRLAGERALVTGSTSGIGAAIAARFAQEGAAVCVTGRDAGRGADVVARIVEAGGTARFVAGDLSVEADCTAVVATAAELLGGLTVLVNNAAAHVDDGAVSDADTERFEAILRVNLVAAMWTCREAIGHMRRAGHGSIVNISSRQAHRASRGLAAYIASKAGLEGLTRSIAVDEAPNHIRANVISPGYVLNERRDAEIDPSRRARLEAMHLTRLGEADDVAHAAVYLASRESEFLTGETIHLDGGGSIARGVTLG